MATFDLRAFGQLRISDAAGAAFDLPTRKTSALLVYLALAGSKGHSRQHLCDIFWEEADLPFARNSLRQALFAIRQAAGGECFVPARDVCALDLPQWRIDVREFDALRRRRTVESLAAALALYQSDLLDGFEPVSPAFDDWLSAEQLAWRRRVIETAAELLSLQLTAEDASAVDTARRLVELDPLDEGAHRTLIRLYIHDGRVGLAIRQYRECAASLARDLGVSPEPETEALYRGILSTRAEACPAAPHATARGSILVVEDDPIMRRLLQEVLESASYRTTAAASAEEALDCLADAAFDLVISDVVMPGIDGVQLIEEMGRRGWRTPAILLTMRSALEAEIEGLESGAIDYLRKPIQKDVLLLRVRNALRGRPGLTSAETMQ